MNITQEPLNPVLVCGSAYTLFDDLRMAQQLFPHAPIIAVKGASSLIKASIIFGLHPGKLDGMREGQLKFHSDFEVHTAGNQKDYSRFKRPKSGYFDKNWGDVGGGCSGWSAVKVAHKMGFDLVVMCGIPLSKGGYANKTPSKLFQNDKILKHYRSFVERDTQYHDTTFSMSGWTREYLDDYTLSDKES